MFTIIETKECFRPLTGIKVSEPNEEVLKLTEIRGFRPLTGIKVSEPIKDI